MPSKREPTIISEDDQFVAVNKPAGLVVHYDGKTKEPSLADWILKKYPNIKNVGEPTTLSNGEVIYRPGIVHRIDRETSGVLLIAKTQKMFEFLKNQFKNHEVHKTYHAFVYGNLKEDEGVISKPIGRGKKDFRQWTVGRGARGEMREAVTNFTVLARGTENNEIFSFLELWPKTGRTHQIRVHLKSIHHPVVCDRLYAPKTAPALGFKRTALHASKIEFRNLKREIVTVLAPFPADFKKAKKILEKVAK